MRSDRATGPEATECPPASIKECRKSDGRPNIVFILCDNTGWGGFSCYGGTNATPRIDKLASEGIRFNSYTVESQCTPTRPGIMTGRRSVRSGTYKVVMGPGAC